MESYRSSYHQLSGVCLQAHYSSLGCHTHDMFDHVTDPIEDVMVVVVCLPHKGRGADNFVLLVNKGLVMSSVKVNAG